MAETLTIGGVNRTANLYRDSLRIEQAAGEFTAVCSFKLNDLDSSLGIQTRDAVTVTDDGTTLFAGEVVDIDNDLLSLALPGRRMSIRCQDYNILVEEAVVDGEEAYIATADSAIIADLFASYRADIDATTYVSTLDASMTITFQDVSLRQALSDICAGTGGRWYVDEAMALHYFTAETNECAWWLSDSPDDVSSFPYQSIKQRLSASTIVNRVLVVGTEVRDWYEDEDSVDAYGERPAVVTDNRITTQAGLDARGAALLDKWANPRVAYDVVTRKIGLRAGMDVRLICGAWGLDETLTVRRLTIYWRGGNRFYALEIGEGIATALTTGRVWLERLGQAEGAISSIDDTIFDTDAPAAPNPLGAGNVTTGTDLDADGHQIVYAEITWSAVADTDLDHYELQLSTQADFTSDVMSRNHPAGGNRHERFVGILGNTTYYVRVRATDWVGNDSAWDYGVGAAYNFTSAADTVAPAQVAGLVAAASRTLIGINWTANTEMDLKHYEIQRADDVAGAPGAWATISLARLNFYIDQDFTDGEIAAEDTFWYQVRAVDTSDNEGDWAAETSAALSQIASDHLAALSVTTVKLAAGAVTAEKITVGQLSAITADLGTITAGTVTGATIRTAAAGARVVLDSTDGLQLYNADPVLCAQLDVDGSGQIGASGGAVPPLTWNALGQFNRIQANQLQIGEFLYDTADGLLLLGPHCYLSPIEWRSLRKQSATLSGAFHQVQGMWLGTRGLIVEEATINLIINPSVETAITGWLGVNVTVTRSDTRSVFGDYSAKGVVTANNGYFRYNPGGAGGRILVDSSTDYTFSAWIHADEAGDEVRIGWTEFNGAVTLGSATTGYTLVAGWQRLVHTSETAATCDRIQAVVDNLDDAHTYYLDAAQVEKKDYATTYCDGDQGYGYAWTGDAHASTSTRAATEINLDDHTGLISENATLSFRLVVQAAYDADAAWPFAVSAFMQAAKDDGLETIAMYFNPADDKIYAVILDGVDTISLTSAAQTFKAKDWLDIVITLDFDSDEYKLYVNGVLEDTSTDTCTPPILEQWNLGSNYLGANQSGAAVCELGVFDKVLTASQVAQVFNLQQPLIDTGSTETPGIYILDGKFRIASSSTGNRIEIVGDEIAGYDGAGTKQFYIRASDGKAVCGAGDVWLDETGVTLTEGAATVNKIKWVNAGGDELCQIFLHESGVTSVVYISGLTPDVGDNSIINLTANQQAGGASRLQVISPSVAGYDAAGTIIAQIGGTSILQIKSHGIKTIGDIRLTDGKAQPGTEAGYAILFVDSADGDLKVKFGDGFVRTIAADS